MDIWVASNFLLFLIMLWKWICKYLSRPLLFASFGHRYVMTTSSKSNWKVVGPITFFLHHFSCTCIKLICLISKTYSEVSLLLLIRSYYTVLAGHHYVDQAHIDQSGFELMDNPHASAFRNLRLQVYTTHTQISKTWGLGEFLEPLRLFCQLSLSTVYKGQMLSPNYSQYSCDSFVN